MLKRLFDILIDAFVRKKHNRALRDILDLQRSIEEFLTKYHLQEKGTDFRLVLENIGQARIDITEIAHLAGKTVGTAKNVQGKHLGPLLEQVSSDLEDLKRGLFTKTVRGSSLAEWLTRLPNSLENLLGAVSVVEYK
jgi:hypothetical protein